MDDIAALIERLRAYHSHTGAYASDATCLHGTHPYDCQKGCAPVTFEAAEALSRLSTSPLPDEIARVQAGLAVIRDSTARVKLREHARNAIAVIERLARENERLNGMLRSEDSLHAIKLARIRELEAELDAIQAMAIKECAAMAQSRGAPGIAEAIRALKPSKGKS